MRLFAFLHFIYIHLSLNTLCPNISSYYFWYLVYLLLSTCYIWYNGCTLCTRYSIFIKVAVHPKFQLGFTYCTRHFNTIQCTRHVAFTSTAFTSFQLASQLFSKLHCDTSKPFSSWVSPFPTTTCSSNFHRWYQFYFKFLSNFLTLISVMHWATF